MTDPIPSPEIPTYRPKFSWRCMLFGHVEPDDDTEIVEEAHGWLLYRCPRCHKVMDAERYLG